MYICMHTQNGPIGGFKKKMSAIPSKQQKKKNRNQKKI